MATRKVHFLILGNTLTVCGRDAASSTVTIKRGIGGGVTCYNCARWLKRHPRKKREQFIY